MQRGEVYFADLNPARGSEANKRRPVLIVSNDGLNRTVARLGRGVITIVPLTSNTDRVYNFQVLLPALASGLPQDSKAQCEQVRSVAAERLTGPAVCRIPSDLMARVEDALRLHLAL